MHTPEQATAMWHGAPTDSTVAGESAPPEGTPDLEVVPCQGGRREHDFYRRTDRRPAEDRPTVCRFCWMQQEADLYAALAEPFLAEARGNPAFDYVGISHTGGGCWAIELTSATTPGLTAYVGDAADGPLNLDHVPERWGASVSYYGDEGDEQDELADPDTLLGSPAEVVAVIAAAFARGTTPLAREQMAAEAEAAWKVRHAAYLAERAAQS